MMALDPVTGTAKRPRRIRLLDAPIDRVQLSDLLGAVISHARSGVPLTIMYLNVHCINVHQRDTAYQDALEHADLVYCDGTGVRLGGWLAGQPLPARMTGADWIDNLCRLCLGARLSLFLVGGVPGAAQQAADILEARYPGLVVVGTAEGYDPNFVTLETINGARPDIVLVGMGTPRQEKWIAANRHAIDAPVVWAVGALFDFVRGHIPRGPRWLTDHGFEWVCRLVAEPRKLWHRYLVGNPLFLWRIVSRYWLGRG